MTTYAWPSTLYATSARWKLVGRPAIQTSPGTGTDVTQELQGARWRAQLEFGKLEYGLEQELAGLLAALAGLSDYVALPYPPAYQRQGGATGSLTLTALMDAKIAQVAGIGGTNPAFKRGDVLTVAGRLHRVTNDANAVSGTATVEIYPPLRANYTAQPVTLTAPTCLMRLLDGEQDEADFEVPWHTTRTVVLVEPLP